MGKKPEYDSDAVRDGIETLPEFAEIELELPAKPPALPLDDGVEEALLESFPASDPPASGRME